MKKIVYLLITLALFVSQTVLGKTSAVKCSTEEESMNLMIASQVHANTLMQKYEKDKKVYEDAYASYRQKKLQNAEELAKINILQSKMAKSSTTWAAYVKEIADVGRISVQKQYQTACDTYVNIANRYHFDIQSTQKSTITVDEIEKDGAKRGGACGISRATVALMFFTEKVAKKRMTKNYKFTKLVNKAGALTVQNPSAICESIKEISGDFGISYATLMEEVDTHLNKSKQKLQKKKPNQQAQKCTVNDAITLSYKQEDFSQKFTLLYNKWSDRYNSLRNASLKNDAQIKEAFYKRKEVDTARAAFFKVFKKEVKIHISGDNHYDLACENYAKLEKQYTKVLADLQKVYHAFGTTASPKTPPSTPTPNTTSTVDTNETYDAMSNKKYNAMVNVINNLSPRIRNSFNTYARSCGADKNKRQKTTFSKINGYHVTAYFKGTYEEGMLNALKQVLALKRLSFANKSIEKYLDTSKKFMSLFLEAAEYYEMKDYSEDNFKKGNQLHPSLVAAYEEFMHSDSAIREVIGKISDVQTRKRIAAYKANNQMMFYFVEKGQYLSRKFFSHASKDHYLKLNAAKTKEIHDTLRNHYKAFADFKKNNETLFKDNSAYTYYLRVLRDYVSESKSFYLSVKSKKKYPNGEDEMMQYIPAQARAAIAESTAGTIEKLLRSYNTLVKEYNRLNM